jgi:ppGpp synthetase/RelA/SpoT-type nucleotidyltranferase
MIARTVEDQLRAEYFELLPPMRRTLLAFEAEVRHLLVPMVLDLMPYERVVVLSRVKECESAINKLRRRQELRVFNPAKIEQYSLASLRDLVGVRVLVFPRRRAEQATTALDPIISNLMPDPVPGISPDDPPIALKYYGHYAPAKTMISVELQIVSSLVGAFWEIEHAAFYKPTPDLQEVLGPSAMEAKNNAVLSALRAFEEEFERLVQKAEKNA